jgi:hypothetical protein
MNQAILNNIDYILPHIKSHFVTDQEFLDELFKLIDNDIDINFDSESFYFLSYKQLKTSKLYFPINRDDTPLDILEGLMEIIENNHMRENIKNKKYLIHFRNYKYRMNFEDSDNTIRKKLFLHASLQLDNPSYIFTYFVRKLNEYENKDTTEHVELLTSIFRIKEILRTLFKHTKTLNRVAV